VSGSLFSERFSARADELGLTVSGAEAAQLAGYYALLARWNRRINLTSLPLDESPGVDTLDRLIFEPLIASALVGDEPVSWLDVGSGGGSPAIPLKIVRPRLALTMVESRQRKAAFLREAVRVLGLARTDVLTERVEALSQSDRRSWDLVTVRAVRTDETLLGVIGALLASGGRLILFGPDRVPEGFELVARRPLPGPDAFVSTLRLVGKGSDGCQTGVR
jgi:16S rRNA (guanine527-N7)-methyltransferase